VKKSNQASPTRKSIWGLWSKGETKSLGKRESQICINTKSMEEKKENNSCTTKKKVKKGAGKQGHGSKTKKDDSQPNK